MDKIPEVEPMYINGVPVIFPFKPYPIQIVYMDRVIQCLKQSTNAVLESPTGTGKTLSLLCSSLGWLLHDREINKYSYDKEFDLAAERIINQSSAETSSAAIKKKTCWGKPRIIYSSRTHSQLSQVVQELKRTSYQSKIKACIIGSRDQLCLKKEVLEESTNVGKVNLCRSLVKNKQCSLYYGVENHKNNILDSENVLDIEDLVRIGTKRKFCPYYMAREAKTKADIIFMPYNYLLDTNTRLSNDIDLTNSVIIFDEAHNVEKMCEEASSLYFTSSNLTLAIEELTYLMKKMMEEEEGGFSYDEGKDFTAFDVSLVKSKLLCLETVVDSINLKDEFVSKGTYMKEMLRNADITEENYKHISTTMHNVVNFLATTKSDIFSYKGHNLDLFYNLIIQVYTDIPSDKIDRCFKVHIQRQELYKGQKGSFQGINKKFQKSNQKVINWWCFSPSFGIEMLLRENVKSIILTSGTLAPLSSLISELGIEVPIRLENRHIISPDQLFITVVNNGYNNEKMNPSFVNRSNSEYIINLGYTVRDFVKIIPDGVLVFFPSYPLLYTCKETWQNQGVWSEINARKPIFVEPRGKQDFSTIMEEYYQTIEAPGSQGACFFAVCRGKVAEGLDFADKNGRGVIITGLPYPPFKDPKVILKKVYLNENKKSNDQISGDEWYTQEATRAMNQAIGRVIRHKDDWGAILLCDQRCSQNNIKSRLSSWLQPRLKVFDNYECVLQALNTFFGGSCIKKLEEKAKIEHKNSCQKFETNFLKGLGISEQTLSEPEEKLNQYFNTPPKMSVKKIGLFDLESNSNEVKDFNFASSSKPTPSMSEVRHAVKKRKVICVPINICESSNSDMDV